MSTKQPEETETKTQDKMAIAVQSNNLINARYEFSLNEVRIFTHLLWKLKPSDTDFGWYYVDFKEILKETGISSHSLHERGMTAIRNLMKKIIKVKLFDSDDFLETPLLSGTRYKEDDGGARVSFHPDLKPFLLQLKEQFTIYEIKNIFKLNSVYSARLYPIMKQYEKIGYREIDIGQMKRILGVENEYKEFAGMEKRVLKIAKAEISEKTDIIVDYEKKKRGRKIHALRFSIEPKAPEKAKILSPLEEKLKDYFLLTHKQTQRVLAKYEDREFLEQILQDIETRYKDNKIKSIASYAYRVLMDTNKTKKSLFDAEMEEKKLAKQQAKQQEQEAKQKAEVERLQKEEIMKKQISDVITSRPMDRMQEELVKFTQSKRNNILGKSLYKLGKEMSKSAEARWRAYIYDMYIKPKEETPTA